MTERICSKDEIFNNATKVSFDRPNRSYAPVVVTIVSSNVENRTVTFTASDKDGVKREFQDVPWDTADMVIDCPTTLPFVPGQLPVKNAEGTLLLSKELIDTLRISGTPKWPRELPEGPLLGRLQIRATSIVVTGAELADGENTAVVINLLDPKLAAQRQTLVLEGKTITLTLTPAGFLACGRLTLQPEDAVDPIIAKQK